MRPTEGKNEEREMEHRNEQEEEQHEHAVALVHAHEKATVPDGKADGNSEHPAVKHSVGHYLERDGNRTAAGKARLRRHRG